MDGRLVRKGEVREKRTVEEGRKRGVGAKK